ncbi:hypothetical protein [Candidatus Tisiphia endosymbiont of Nemotelus nigrinus]|uniref:hypothetical protein n=1 Tax=Candidatus Tisiphia endosymbiont of Nemotelus nigrinus TaxID=3066263 RepID=UPI00312CC240
MKQSNKCGLPLHSRDLAMTGIFLPNVIYGRSPLMGLDGVHNCRKLEEGVLNRVTSLREDRRSTKQSIK